MNSKAAAARLQKLERKFAAHKAENEMEATRARIIISETKLRLLAQLDALEKMHILFDPKKAKQVRHGPVEAEQVSDEVSALRDEIKERIDSMNAAVADWQDAADGDAENDFESAKVDIEEWL